MKKILYYLNKAFDIILDRIEYNSDLSYKQLSLFRIFIGLFFLFVYIPSWEWIGEIPQAFFNPPYLSVANLFKDFLPAVVFRLLDVVFYCLMGCVTVGLFTKFSLLASFFIGIFSNSFAYSLGKIDHSIMIWFLLLILAFCSTDKMYALRPSTSVSNRNKKMALGIFSVSLAFGLFTAGFYKYINWLDFDLSENGFLRWFYQGYFSSNRTALLASSVFFFPQVILEIMDYIAVIFELTAGVFFLGGRKSWRFYLVVAGLFHIINLLLLNISFIVHLPVYGLFLLSPFFEFIVDKYKITYLLKKVLFFAVFLQILFLSLTSIFNNSFFINIPAVKNDTYIISLLLWTVFLIISIYSFKKRLYNFN